MNNSKISCVRKFRNFTVFNCLPLAEFGFDLVGRNYSSVDLERWPLGITTLVTAKMIYTKLTYTTYVNVLSIQIYLCDYGNEISGDTRSQVVCLVSRLNR